MSENNKDLTTSQKTEKVQKKESKPGVFQRAAKWLHELKVEAKKVVWPTPKQVVKNTLIVVACVIVVGVFIWMFDAVAGAGIKAFLNLFHHH